MAEGNRVTAKKYKRGTNERADKVLEGWNVTIWMVQGPAGLLPIAAETKEEAIRIYKERPVKKW